MRNRAPPRLDGRVRDDPETATILKERWPPPRGHRRLCVGLERVRRGSRLLATAWYVQLDAHRQPVATFRCWTVAGPHARMQVGLERYDARGRLRDREIRWQASAERPPSH